MKYIVIPAYNEEKTIGDVVRRALLVCPNVVVVDDGSTDGTRRAGKEAGAYVIRHSINRGVGAAWGTGFAHALKNGAQVIITMDADGQHNPQHINNLIHPIKAQEADIVIGARDFSKGAPITRVLPNRIANLTTRVLFGVKTADSQSGFRVFSKYALEQMDLQTNHFEVCTEMFGEAKRLGLKLKEVPIESIYTNYSLSKGQSFINGLKTLRALIFHKLLK